MGDIADKFIPQRIELYLFVQISPGIKECGTNNEPEKNGKADMRDQLMKYFSSIVGVAECHLFSSENVNLGNAHHTLNTGIPFLPADQFVTSQFTCAVIKLHMFHDHGTHRDLGIKSGGITRKFFK